MSAPASPAKRGDILLTENRESSTSIHFHTSHNIVYTFNVILSVDAEGNAKRIVDVRDYGIDKRGRSGKEIPANRWVLSKNRIDTERFISDLKEQLRDRWDANRFDNIEDAKTFARQYLK